MRARVTVLPAIVITTAADARANSYDALSRSFRYTCLLAATGGGSVTCVMRSPGSSTVSRSGVLSGRRWKSPIGTARVLFGPCTWIVASKAAIATHISDGFVAMQCSLVPRTASERLLPVMAGQPVPGSRLLQGIAVSRKYMHRVRWSKLPAVVAILRSWAEAPARRACVQPEEAG